LGLCHILTARIAFQKEKARLNIYPLFTRATLGNIALREDAKQVEMYVR
jgi:hypothetical protein